MPEMIRGRYEVREVAGRGGQGEVVRALDTQHDRTVAVKIRLDADRESTLSEARVLLDLKPHPNLPLVRDDFFEDDRYYMVVDWIEGASLERLLAARGDPGLPVSSVLAWLGQVAGAVDHLHTHTPAIVHRDVKPANIILTPDGRVVLVDFGIARASGAPARSEGTQGFIAPEVVTGSPPAPAADVYALAATAFTLLTGKPPAGIRPDWEGVDASATGVIERALRRGLATDPARRPGSARELVEQLRAFLSADLPTGVVTFLVTSVVDAPRMWDDAPDDMGTAVARLDHLLAETVERHKGRVVRARGDGEASLSVFASAPAAVAAALDVQRAVLGATWPERATPKLRVALHAGEAELRGGDYVGVAPSHAARIRDAAHGGQTLASESVAQLARAHLPAGAELADLGAHRLADLTRPEHLYELRHTDLPSGFPALRSLDGTPNNLPVQLTSFIGRDDELAELSTLLGGARLVTLAGAGGVGKTRLSLQLAAGHLDRSPEGVWFVQLAPLSDAALVPQQAAQAVGVREEPGKSISDSLAEHLRDRSALVVLDNCEHLIQAAAELATKLLSSCPGVRIVATTREPLNVEGEAVWRVPALPIPDPANLPPLEELAQFESVHLFRDRATLAKPQFALTPENAEAVARICLRVGGIPLAIELAAARVKALSVEEIATKLDESFKILVGGSRTGLAHHQTLQATIDWSYDLLSEDEKTLYSRLSVFVGGFTLAAATDVCGEGLDG